MKYRLWLADHGLAHVPTGVCHSGVAGEKFHEGHRYVGQRLRKMAAELDYSRLTGDDLPAKMIAYIQQGFESLLSAAEAGGPRGLYVVSLEQWSFYYTSLVWDQLQVQKKREQLDEKRATQRFDGYALAGEEEAE